jgi:putative tricarboxylic transport membrane protein
MRRAEIVTAVILGILSIYLMWKSGEAPSWNPDVARFDNIGLIEGEGPGSGFWPFWLSAIMLACSIWIGINWYRRTSPPSQSEEEFLDGYGRRMLFVVGGGLLGFLVLIEVVGFYGAILAFMIYYVRFLGSHSWWATLSISIGLVVTSFFFFDIAMRIVLPKGLSEPLFIPLYDIFL